MRPDRLLLLLVLAIAGGCTSVLEYVGNRLKGGPDSQPPAAQVAPGWIDAADAQVQSTPAELAYWWSVFHDPVLDGLVQTAARQSLTLREAGYRVLQGRAARAIAAGNLFPQQQQMIGGYARNAASTAAAN